MMAAIIAVRIFNQNYYASKKTPSDESEGEKTVNFYLSALQPFEKKLLLSLSFACEIDCSSCRNQN